MNIVYNSEIVNNKTTKKQKKKYSQKRNLNYTCIRYEIKSYCRHIIVINLFELITSF